MAKVAFKTQFSCLKKYTRYNCRCPRCPGPPPQACRYDPERAFRAHLSELVTRRGGITKSIQMAPAVYVYASKSQQMKYNEPVIWPKAHGTLTAVRAPLMNKLLTSCDWVWWWLDLVRMGLWLYADACIWTYKIWYVCKPKDEFAAFLILLLLCPKYQGSLSVWLTVRQ